MISGQLARGRPRVGQCRPLGGHSLSAADAGPASAAKAVKGKIAPASRRSEAIIGHSSWDHHLLAR